MERIWQEVEGYLMYCEKVRGMTETTLQGKRSVIARFVRVTEVESVTEIDNVVFARWMGSLGASARSVNSYNTVIVAMVKYFRMTGASVPLNLTLVRKLKEGEVRRRFYAAEEVERVVAGPGGNEVGVATRLMIKIMFETGMRIAEVTRLRWNEVDGRQIRFVGKGRKPREVYVTAATRRELEEYRVAAGYKWSDYVWGSPWNGEPPTTATVRNWLKRAFLAVGFEDFYPHALRHSFATDLQRRGASVAEIKEMLGHESIATTERYLHGFDGKMRELFEKYR